ncbi:hypothetical protein HMPREF0290_1859 [Corynebacterium efficiens YS-314]|nr:hypothetical protein HMPREF0290_1859 [Corynebacterium efficiens YS-314]
MSPNPRHQVVLRDRTCSRSPVPTNAKHRRVCNVLQISIIEEV